MENKFKLKKFLATASAFAMIAGSTSAMGAIVDTNADVTILEDGTNSAGNLDAVFNNGDSIKLGGAHDITTGGNVVFGAPGVDIDGNAGQTFNVGHDVTIPDGAGALKMKLDITAGHFNNGNNDITEQVVMTGGELTANDLTGVGGSGGLTVSGASVVNINAFQGGNILAQGTAVVNVADTVTGALTVNEGARFVGNANATNVSGAVVVNTTSVDMNTMQNAGAAVTLTAGKLTMNDATGAVEVTAGALIMNDAATTFTVNGGTATVNDITGNALVANGGVVTSTGTVGGTLTVNNAARFAGDANASDVTGAVVVNTTNVDVNKIHDAAAAVTLTAGNLTMNDATGAVEVTAGALIMNDAKSTFTVNGGTATVNDITGNALVANGGVVTSTGTVGGTLTVNNAARFTGDANASDVTGAVVVNTTNVDVNKIHDAAAAVTLTAGNLTMNDAAGAVTVTAGALVMNNAATTFTVNGGTATVRNVTGNALVANDGVVTSTGTVGGTLTVNDAARFAGDANASDVTGAVVVNTTSVDMNTIQDAAAAVTLTAGKLTMDDAAGAVLVTDGALVMHDAATTFTVNGGTATVRHVTGNALVANDGVVTSAGTVGGTLTVNDAARFAGAANASDVTGAVVVNTTSVDMNTIQDAAAAVTLTAGKLTMNDATGAAAITVTSGDLVINSIAHANSSFVVNGGTAKVAAGVAGSVAVNNGAEVSITGAIGGAIDGNNDSTITLGAGATAGAITKGDTIITTANREFAAIGDVATEDSLNLLDIRDASEVTLSGNSHISKIKTENAGKIVLNKDGGSFKFNEVELTVGSKFGLEIAENAKIMNGAGAGVSVNIGASDKKLSELKFTADKTLTLEDGVNIYADVLNSGANEGTLTFEGSSVLDAVSGANKIDAINVNGGEGKVVHIAQNITANGNVTLGAKSTLELAGNITSAAIKGAAAGNGTLKMVNTIAATVDSTIGAGNAVDVIELAGHNVTFSKAVTHEKDIKFTSDTASTATFATADVQKANFINDSGQDGVAHKVVFGTNVNLTGTLGAANRTIGFDLGTSDSTATLEGTVAANGANFFGKTDGTAGTLTIAKDGVTVNSAGTKANKLLAVNVNENSTIANGTAAVTTTVALGKTGTFGGTIEGTTFKLAGADSVATFSKDAILDVAVTTGVADKGIVNFGGAATVNKDIGTVAAKVKTVNFGAEAGQVLTLNANVYAKESINLKETTTKLAKDVILESDVVNANNASIDLGSSKMTVNGGALQFNGTNTITTIVTDSGNTVSAGQMIAAKGTLDYNGAKLVIVADDSAGSRPTNGSSRSFTLIKNDTTAAVTKALDLANVTIDDTKHTLTKWTPSLDANGGLVLTQTDDAKDALKAKLKGAGGLTANASKNIELLTAAAPGSDGYKITALLDELTAAEAVDAEARLHSLDTTTDNISSTMDNVASSISQRVSVVQPGTSVQSKKVANAYVSGVASGDDTARFGAWFSPFFSKTTQKARKGQAGYRDTTFGGSLGVDTKVNDDMIVGGAFTFANAEAKHRDHKSGDKTKVNSVMLSVYGMQQINDLWFAQASATVGSNDVDNTEKKRALVGYDSVKSKYNAMSFAGDLLFGFNYATEGLTLTPMGGMRYSRVNSAGFKKSGSTTGQNADVSQKASNKLDLVLGARVVAGMFDVNGATVTPELHGFINYDVIGKAAKVEDRIGGTSQALASNTPKPAKASYNVGLGVNADYGMMEYGVGYDLHLSDKRVGHEGSLKVRVNF